MAKDLSANLDLNLLKTLLVIYQEKNLRKASERLFVTQPAVSHALQKLRLHFGDDLFTKTRTGLTPTPYADQLCSELSPALEGLFKAVNTTQEFDPQQLTGKLKIALSPIFLCAFGSQLYLSIQKEAPNCQIEIIIWNVNTFAELLNGNIQIALNYDITSTSKELYRRTLPKVKPVVIVRKDHPYKKATIGVMDAKDATWACMIIPGRNEQATDVEHYFSYYDLVPKIGFRSTSPETILQVVRQTDMLFPTNNLIVADDHPELRKIDTAIEGPMLDSTTMCFYHQSKHKDPLTQWLYNHITQQYQAINVN